MTTPESPADDPAADHLRLMTLVFGTICSQVVGTAARLGIADRIGDGTRDTAELARALGAEPGALNRLLRGLVSLGLLDGEDDSNGGGFRLTPTGALLRTDRPDSVATAVLLFTDPSMLDSWKRAEKAVRTGRPTFAEIYGEDFFAHLEGRADLSARFNATMRQITLPIARALPAAYDFTRAEVLADIGGGDGTVLAEILRACPRLHGALQDTATGLAECDAVLAAAGVADRVSMHPGDFFDDVPAADTYLLKSIVHDWDDEHCGTLLDTVRRRIPAHGRLLLVESMLPDTVDTSDPTPYLTDLNMLVNMGGKERTRGEFDDLCARSGFALSAVHPLGGPLPYSVLEATPR